MRGLPDKFSPSCSFSFLIFLIPSSREPNDYMLLMEVEENKTYNKMHNVVSVSVFLGAHAVSKHSLVQQALQHKIHSSLLCLPLFYLSIKSTFSSNSHHVRGLSDNFFFHHAPSLFQYFNFIYCFSHSTRYPSPKHDTTLGKVMYLAMRLYKQKDL